MMQQSNGTLAQQYRSDQTDSSPLRVSVDVWLTQLVLLRRWTMEREPTVEQIVDRIMALRCGESCDVKLNPRITRIGNLEWLLPICVQQFGTQIDMCEHAEGDQVALTIMAAATRRQKTTQPMGRDIPIAQPEEELTDVAAGQLVAAA
jgi:hypothetical protein